MWNVREREENRVERWEENEKRQRGDTKNNLCGWLFFNAGNKV